MGTLEHIFWQLTDLNSRTEMDWKNINNILTNTMINNVQKKSLKTKEMLEKIEER